MKLFKSKKKDFTKELLKRVSKTKEGSLATKFILQFVPADIRSPSEAFKPTQEKKRHKHYGNKAMRKAYDGTIGITNKHGVVGQVLANMKRERTLKAKEISGTH